MMTRLSFLAYVPAKTCGFPAGGGSGAEGGLGGSPYHGAGADLDGYELHADYHGRGGDSIIETGEDLSS